MAAKDLDTVILGKELRIEEFIAIARFRAKVEFSAEYRERVERSCRIVHEFMDKGKVMYGVNTGFGALSTQLISPQETSLLQKNILLSHATSVGDPHNEENVRAIMLMVLQNLGQGYSGVRIETLERYAEFLNLGITPFAPQEGSVGYLSVEAHIALVLLGEGKAYVNGELVPSAAALREFGLRPISLSMKEGLALISGTTGAAALGIMALHDMINASKAADIIGAMAVEVLKGTTRAFDERLMSVRPHPEQRKTAENIRTILQDSEIAKKYIDYRLQDALSLRAIPQLHGAAKKTLQDAKSVLEIEMNACCDNPVVWPDPVDSEVMSGSNCDSSYIGIELDSSCIAATAIAKSSERRNNRLINGKLSEFPSFLIQKAGLNSGLMIPQYSQAGLLNDMKTLSHPASVDSIPTCADQEDYVAMGYNASKKALKVASNLQYILAIELLSVYNAHQFMEEDAKPGSASSAVLEKIQETVPVLKEDIYLYPHLENLKCLIHSGELVDLVETKIGKLL